MGKKKSKGTQKVNPLMDASIASPPYETAFGISNTEEMKGEKQDKPVKLHSCKCVKKKINNNRRRTRTWESITNLYGDADTTEVWDDEEYKPKSFSSPKLHKQENPKAIVDNSESNDVLYPTSNLHPRPKKLKPIFSLIGLYHKHKKNKQKKSKIRQYFNEDTEEADVKFSPYTEPELKFKLRKKPKKELKDQYDTGVLSDLICTQGPCREALENLYNLHGLKYIPNKKENVIKSGKNYNKKEIEINKKSKNKHAKAIESTKDGNVGYGDQISLTPLKKHDSKDLQCKCSFIDKMMGHTICKCRDNIESTLQTSNNVHDDYSNKEKTKTETLSKVNNILKKSKNKQTKAIDSTKDGNVGYGDQILLTPLKKHDLKDLQCKCTFNGKMMGHTICKCRDNIESTLQTSNNVHDDYSNKEKTKTETLSKVNNILKKSKNKQTKTIESTKDGNAGYGDQMSLTPLKQHDLKDLQCKCSFIDKMMGHTICKCRDNIESTLQTLNNVHDDNSNKEKTKTEILSKVNKIFKKSKTKQSKAIESAKDGNVGYGDQMSLTPLKQHDLKYLQCKCSFIDTMMGHTICKCKDNIESTLQTSNNVYDDNSNKQKTKSETLLKVIKILKKSKNKQDKALRATKDRNVGYSDKISLTPLKKHDLKDLQCKCSFIDKMMGHTICKCKDNIESTLQTSNNVYDGNSNKEKTKSETLLKVIKILKKSKNKQDKALRATKDRNVGYGDKISLTPLKKHDLKDLQCKCSFIDKMMGHTICKCRNNIESTLKTSNNIYDDNSNKKKTKTKTLSKVNKIMKKSKNKQAKALKTTKHGNVGYGDQISSTPLKKHDLKDLQCKCSFIDKMMGHTICKCRDNIESTLPTSRNVNNPTGDPLLEMKVNLTDMRVLNSSEVNKKIRKLGRTEKNENMSCVCPSHIKLLDDDKVYERGRYEKQDIIECKDSTCDLKVRDIKLKSRKKKRPKSPVYKEDKKHLFEVRLDSTNMDIINSNEIKDIVREASQNNIICSTGICKKMSKDRNVQLNCKCIGKKMKHFVNESDNRRFRVRNPEKKCKLSYLCSRVFSKSENWTGQEENRKRRPMRGNGYSTNIRRDGTIVRSHTHYKRNGVMINLPRGQTSKKGAYVGGKLSDVWCKCFCECDMKPKKPVKKPPPKKPPIKKKPKKKVSRRRRRRGFFRKKKKDNRTLTDKILDCLEREQEDCEKKVKKKSKEYKKNEERAIKENKKICEEEKETFRRQQYRMDCLTNFISGVLNVSFESVKTVLKIPFSMIGDPISSFIYVKEKIKDPPAAIVRILEWFVRTWRNKSSTIARAVDESTTLNVIADQIESTALYNALMAPRGKSQAEKNLYERRLRLRNRRIQKRQEQALYGCQHILLTTMRKTPCLWCYHICPELYPQCLNFVSFMNNFLHIILYCGAIMCWTPCIVCFEMCRAFMCCLLCTH